MNGELRDLRFPIESDANVSILTFEDAEGKKAFWHTSAHVLAQAVQHLYPEAKLTIGPAVDNGFYYDIDVEKPFVAEDLEKIEAEMKKIVKEGEALERFELSGDEAKELMKDNPYKVELIEEHAGKGEKLSFFRQGDFTDLCAGPHLMNTSPIKAIKLTQCTGAYWRGDANNRMQMCIRDSGGSAVFFRTKGAVPGVPRLLSARPGCGFHRHPAGCPPGTASLSAG